MDTETHGARRRLEILEAATDLSTADGLAGLSFARLAAEVGLTKAGVAAHFDSKEALQLAVVRTAAEAYALPLADATRASEPGLDRLRSLALAWLQHLDTIEYRSGCFFLAAGQAFAGKPGAVRDAIARHTRRFLEMLEEQALLASRLGELPPDRVPSVLAFQIHALAQEANLRRELLDDGEAFEKAHDALDDLLTRVPEPRASRRKARKPSPRTRPTKETS